MSIEPPFRLVEPAAGTFLLASPWLEDPNFARTVVLLCAHEKEGSYGLVVNRPSPTTLAQVSSDDVLLAGRTDPLWVGGPVEPGTLQILHRLGPDVPGSLPLLADLHLGGDTRVLRDRLSERGDPEGLVRFVVGYSGWGEGQLEDEIAERSWIVGPADPALVFDPQADAVWRRALRGLGPAFAALAREPIDPSWN